MMSAMLIAATVAVLAGLGTIALGIPVKEFSFGNTMILSGTIGVCTGLILFGISAVLAELKVVSHRLRLRVSTDADSKPVPPLPGAEKDEIDIAAAPPLEDLWREGGTLRGRVRQPEGSIPPPVPEPESELVPKPRRNLLFATASRKERERAERRAATDPFSDFRPPPIDAPSSEPLAPSAAPNFEDSWSKPERDRPAEPSLPPLPRRLARAAPAFTEPGPTSSSRGEPQTVTVIKSGVVDGMAYSLYSDGSIEAQMPEGMMRFGSIDELRRHLDQRP
jgi:hypothetical protein